MTNMMQGAVSPANLQVLVSLPPEGTYDRLLGALQATGGAVGAQSRPSSMAFVAVKQSIWATSNVRIRYNGVASLTPAEGGTMLQLSASIDWGSAVPLFIMYAVMAVVIAIWNIASGLIIGVVGSGVTAWLLSSNYRDEALRKITGALASPVPAPQAFAQTAPAGDNIAQIQRLAQLRDSGAITAAEFEAKKAELLRGV
jgi:hypothetical protein